MCVRQAATGSGSSSRVAAATASQSRSTSGSPKTVCAQPSFGKATIDQLIRRLFDRVQVALGELPHAGLADAGAVEVGEQLRLRVAGDADQRAVLLRQVVDLREHPGRRPAERVLVGVLDPGAAHVLVGVVDVDVAGAPLVRAARDRPHERRVLGQRRQPQRTWPSPTFAPTSTASRA